VGSNHVEGIAWLVLLANGECHNGGHVTGEKILAT
jgi:hypothetical protein